MAPVDIRPPGYLPQGTFSGTIPGEKGIERRRRLAEVLAQQGTSTAPVQHWTQGAARVAQSLAGALGNYQANQMEQQRSSALADAMRTGTAEQLLGTGDEQLMQLGKIRYQMEQDKKEAERQAAQDAYTRSAAPDVQEIKGPNGETLGLAQWDRNINDWVPFHAPSGVAPATGLGGMPQSTKPLTEGEVKQNIYTRRAAQSNDLLSSNDADAALTDLTGRAASSAPGVLKPFANYMKTPGYKDAEQYGGEFLTAILRQESQASVRPDEFEMYGNVYLPQPGDEKRDIERKRRARTRAVQDLQSGMASRDILLKELDRQRQENAAAPPLPSVGGAPAQHPMQGAPAPIPDARAGEVPLPSAAAPAPPPPQGGGYPKPTDPQSQQIPDALWNSWPPEIQQQWIQGK